MSSFSFKEFTIVQNHSALKVGGDAMILGAFINCDKASNCLDIGAGTGVLSLMIAQRNSTVKIDAIEIDADSVIDLKTNFKSSKWMDRLSIVYDDFLTFSFNIRYDLIVSNPPFYETTNRSVKENIARAKHNSSLPFEYLFTKVEKLLTDDGRFYIILPNENANKWIEFAKKMKLNCIKQILILAKENKPKRSILCFSKEDVFFDDNILIVRNEDNTYTEEYKKLTQDFHSKRL